MHPPMHYHTGRLEVKGALIKLLKEEIIKMVRQIKDIRSIKMIYGFVKALKEKDSGN